MEDKFTITVPKPCSADWDAMTPEMTGRFCSSCTKSVIDFTDKTTEEIQLFFIKNKGQKICGRFNNEQINRFDLQIPQSVLRQQMSFHKAFLLTLFVVMGSTLFSCKNQDDASLGEVSVVNDSVENRRTMGVIIMPPDSIHKTDSVKKKEVNTVNSRPVVTGDVEVIVPDDTPPSQPKPAQKSVYNASEVEVLPNYPGGIRTFYNYFSTNFKRSDADKNVTGKVIVSFIVEKDGSLSTIKILRGINETLNTEVIRVLKASEKWSVGEMNGEKVRVLYSLPIQIK